MIFSSIEFIYVFLPAVLVAFFAARLLLGRTAGLVVLTLASFGFYSHWRLDYLWILLGSILVNYGLARLLAPGTRRNVPILLLAVAANLGLLFWFKYAPFASGILNQLGLTNVLFTEQALIGLRILAEACDRSDARLVVQPGVRSVDETAPAWKRQAMIERENDWVNAAAEMGIARLLRPGTNLFAADYAYDFDHHLNDKGVAVLERQLTPALKNELASSAFGGWLAADGLGRVQGPHPKWDLPFFRWAVGPSTTLTFESDGSPVMLQLECRRSGHCGPRIAVLLDGQFVGNYALGSTGEFREIDVPLQPAEGVHEIEIQYAHLLAVNSKRSKAVVYKSLQIGSAREGMLSSQAPAVNAPGGRCDVREYDSAAVSTLKYEARNRK